MKEIPNQVEVAYPLDDRDMLLGALGEAIENLRYKCNKGKIKNPRTETVKVNYYRALIYSISTYNAILKDKDLDKLEAKIDELKKAIKYPTIEGDTPTDEDLDEVNDLLKELKSSGDNE